MTLKLIFNITLTFIIIYIFFIYNVENLIENLENTTGGQTGQTGPTGGQSGPTGGQSGGQSEPSGGQSGPTGGQSGGQTGPTGGQTPGTNTQFTDQQKIDIKNIINDLYMTDVDAIRNLSDVATKLQTPSGLIIPGQLNVKGKIATNDLDPSDMPVGWIGGLRFIDGYASGNMGFGPNKTTINAQIKQSGDIIGKNLNVNDKIITNDLIFTNGFTTGNMVFGPNDTTINAQINNDGNINFVNGFVSGNMIFGPNNAHIKQSGDIEGYNLNLRGGLSFINAQIDKDGNIEGNNINLKNGLQIKSDGIKINAQIDKDGNIEGNTIKFNGDITGPNVTIKNDGSIIGDNVSAKFITTDRLMFTNGNANNLNFGSTNTNTNMFVSKTQIKQNGDIEAANLNLTGKIVTNDLNFTNGFTSGNMAFGSINTIVNAKISKDGNIEGNNLNLKGVLQFTDGTKINAKIDKNGNIEGNTIKFTGGITGPNIMIKNDGSIIGNNVNAKNITTDKLMFTNGIMSDDMVFGPNAKISKDGNIEGNNLKLKGNLTVNDILIKKNRARIIRVGNINSTDVIDENSFKNAFRFLGNANNANAASTTSAEKKKDKSLAAEDFWSLIEIRVFDDTGINRAANGTVKQITGKPDTSQFKFNKVDFIIDGDIFRINKDNDNGVNGYIGGKGKHLLEINLGDEYNISQIQLFNRNDPIDPKEPKVSNRMNDTIVELISDLNYTNATANDKTVPQVLYLNRRINTGLWDGIYYKEFIL
jgi:hypothetical protein